MWPRTGLNSSTTPKTLSFLETSGFVSQKPLVVLTAFALAVEGVRRIRHHSRREFDLAVAGFGSIPQVYLRLGAADRRTVRKEVASVALRTKWRAAHERDVDLELTTEHSKVCYRKKRSRHGSCVPLRGK